MKFLILVLLLIPTLAKADAYMDEYKHKNLRRDETYKGQTKDLKDEMKSEIQSNPLEDRPASVKAQELPPPSEAKSKSAVGGPQMPANMNLQDAAAMGRQLRDQQKSQQSQQKRK